MEMFLNILCKMVVIEYYRTILNMGEININDLYIEYILYYFVLRVIFGDNKYINGI